jgi:Flp pilus assembly pilin Flp
VDVRGAQRWRPRLGSDERGLTTVEYTIVLVLIAAAAVSAWQAFGTDLRQHLGWAHTTIRDHLTDTRKGP